jgi:NAD(P)-dependent dehydrogenase (short-subunit alcohol dehydrogenase family)
MSSRTRVVIAGVSSDIGLALANSWHNKQAEIFASYRTLSPQLQAVQQQFSALLPCDFSDAKSIDSCADALVQQARDWDVLVMCAGTMEPIERFDQCDADAWERGLYINFTGQLRFVRKMLAARREAVGDALPLVLFFAGGGSNGAPIHFSSYTLSKIALTKATELLDAELPDVRFAILGPGWVKTKIHAETLRAGDSASAGAATRTQEKYEADDFVPMEQVVACCHWLEAAPRAVIGGRNFSAAHDFRDVQHLTNTLQNQPDMFKLRRSGNDNLTK